jgi:hypothetical protein
MTWGSAKRLLMSAILSIYLALFTCSYSDDEDHDDKKARRRNMVESTLSPWLPDGSPAPLAREIGVGRRDGGGAARPSMVASGDHTGRRLTEA